MRKILFWIWLCASPLLAYTQGAATARPDSSLRIYIAPNIGLRDTSSIAPYIRQLRVLNRRSDTVQVQEILIEPFISNASGNKMPVTISKDNKAPGKFQLIPGEYAAYDISANLARPDSYFASITLRYSVIKNDSASKAVKPIQVDLIAVRTPPKDKPQRTFYELEPIETVLSVGGCHADLSISIRDTLGTGGTLRLPFVQLDRKDGDALSQAPCSRMEFLIASGDSLLPYPGEELNFAPDEAKTIVVRFHKLPVGSEYTGSVTVKGHGMKEVSEDITIRVRKHMCSAAIWITAGLLLALLAKFLQNTLSPRLTQREALLRRQEEFQTAANRLKLMNETEKGILSGIFHDISDDLAAIRNATFSSADLKAKLDRYGSKLDLFYAAVKVRVGIEAVGTDLDTSTYTQQLNTAYDLLRATDADNAALEQSVSTLQAIPDQINAQVKAALKTQCSQLSTAIGNGADFLAPGLADTFKGLLSAITDQIDTDLPKSLVAYGELRIKIGAALCAGITEKLAIAPAGLPADKWKAAVVEAQVELAGVAGSEDPDALFAAFQSAAKIYIKAMLDLAAEALGGTNAEIDAARTTLASDAPDALDKAYDAAIKIVEALQTTGGGSLDEMNARAVAPTTESSEEASPAKFAMMNALPVGVLVETTPGSVQQSNPLFRTRMTLFFVELAFSSIILIFSVIVGLQILYLPDLTWGSISDIFAAFGWGFGLHAVTSNTDVGNNVFKFVTGKLNGSSNAGNSAAGGQGGA